MSEPEYKTEKEAREAYREKGLPQEVIEQLVFGRYGPMKEFLKLFGTAGNTAVERKTQP